MEPPVRIRQARESDRAAIGRIHQDAARTGGAGLYSPEEIEAWVGWIREDHYALDVPGHLFLVAERDGSVVGFGRADLPRGEIEALYVAPHCGGLGIGRQLLSSMEEKAREAGAERLALNASLPARLFYERTGYREVGQRRWESPGGGSVLIVRMEKAIRPR